MNDLELVESKLLYDKEIIIEQNIFTILKFKVSKFKIESSISILQYFDYAKQKCTWALK